MFGKVIFSYPNLGKARVIYFTNNWIYTTNHKRIAVNYFWFVILSGICGMVLATIIRLEMAYPGVGILAGDSLQYLSVVTAHAVIMVFFMVMPLIFGAFGNFLLPTQLGVHDVAFPRLNSAAFWFLPAGLIMLCQLVCLDRRYQRMNCFSAREMQALLKTRFYPDPSEGNEFKSFMTEVLLGVRYVSNDLTTIDSHTLLLHQFGLSKESSNRLLVNFLANSNIISIYEFYAGIFVENVINSNFKYFFWVCSDINLFFAKYVGYPGKLPVIKDNETHRYMSLFNFVGASVTYVKNEVERLANFFFFVPDLSKSLSFSLNWVYTLPNRKVLNFVYGYMDNAYYIEGRFMQTWPTLVHPTVYTCYNFKETKYSFALPSLNMFVDHYSLNFNVLYHAYSRSLLLWSYVVKRDFLIYVNQLLQMLYSWFDSILSYWSIVINNIFNLNFYTIFGIKFFKSLYYNLFTLVNFDKNFFSSFFFLPYWFINFFNNNLNNFSFKSYFFTYFNFISFNVNQNLNIITTNNRQSSVTNNLLWEQSENTSLFRFQRALNPVFRYDYKLGNYFTKEDLSISPHLFPTISEITGGIRKSSWFFSGKFNEIFHENVSNYLTIFTGKSSKTGTLSNPYIHNTFSYYNFFNSLTDQTNLINIRWVAVNTLDQKFHRMFLTSSMQQRVFSNWRQLKFTREAWRCKLLAARNQKTLYRRYVEEDGIFWLIERNAKDVLPGWAMITPFSARSKFTAIGKVDIGLMGVFLVLNSSIVSSANFLVTYRYLSTLNNRKMRDARAFFAEGMLVSSWMMIGANPMLAIGILMLLCDRHWQTSFFDYSGGGDTVLFQHMFWFFGHPEVYVIMIPAFGFNNTILSFYLRKRVSARASLMYSMYTIAFLGFFVWGHHMYMVGLSHTTRMLFSTLTVMISIPAATKLMHWCVTLVNSSFAMELPFVFCLLFIFFFVSGGVSGMAVANTGTDVLFHDTFYVVGHFHVMFAGSIMFASFGAFYFYFPAIFGVKFSRIWGYLNCCYYLIGQLMTVIPMIWLGFSGMPRRVLDYPATLGGWHAVASAGHLLSVAGLMAFFIMLFDSLRQARAATRNTFGISRFNTRLNFYIYEVARTKYLQRKGWYISRFNKPIRLNTKSLFNYNYEYYELTLFSYTFLKK